jgi:hypothetical protein
MNLQNRNRVRRLQRQSEAKVRQEAYSKLTPQQKLDRLPPDGANAQRARLQKSSAK